MSPSPLLAAALLLGAALAQAQAQFLSADPSIALQPPPLHQGAFASFGVQPVAVAQPVAQPVAQSFLQPLPMLRQQQQQPQPQQPLAHRAVVRNAEDEARLPEELRNNFYKDPRIAEGLAKSSWFTPGEEQVVDREAEKIPREQIFKLLKNAGLARRR
ncbi:Uracil phosphoribosyltransferase [Frankliniella fusca]|uniref:Uracil phosphoribosyltransferase n=1 Tax=Frankliniella fusca TaxID=407009 RepID=A0AAE1HQM9_9NEOP|nr:Uracil phosphoribosyltransferase [Frankliniella fusca]